MRNIQRRRVFYIAGLGSAACLAFKASWADSTSSSPNALAVMNAQPEFSYWVKILNYSGLSAFAEDTPKFTAFIPTNAAVSKYPSVLNEILAGSGGKAFPDTTPQTLFVRSHIIRGLHPLSEFSDKTAVVITAAGGSLTIDGSMPGSFELMWVSVDMRVATAHVQDKPFIASNALIYPIDSVALK